MWLWYIQIFFSEALCNLQYNYTCSIIMILSIFQVWSDRAAQVCWIRERSGKRTQQLNRCIVYILLIVLSCTVYTVYYKMMLKSLAYSFCYIDCILIIAHILTHIIHTYMIDFQTAFNVPITCMSISNSQPTTQHNY